MNARDVSAASSVGLVDKAHLRECELLVKDVFGLPDLETPPAWTLYFMSQHGGIVVGAFAEQTLIATLYGFPSFDSQRTHLGLIAACVHPDHRGQGLLLRLFAEIRKAALEHGYDLAKWTTGSMNTRNLYIYLHRLGARVVAFEPLMYSGLIEGVDPAGADADEVELEWCLKDSTNPLPDLRQLSLKEVGQRAVTRTRTLATGLRVLEDYSDSILGEVCAVELPWSTTTLEAQSMQLAAEWRDAVRTTALSFLARGYVGYDVVLDREEQRAWLMFHSANRVTHDPA